jgi:hypothetical protein
MKGFTVAAVPASERTGAMMENVDTKDTQDTKDTDQRRMVRMANFLVVEYDITLNDGGMIFALAALAVTAATDETVGPKVTTEAVDSVLSAAARGDERLAGNLMRAFMYYVKNT